MKKNVILLSNAAINKFSILMYLEGIIYTLDS